MRYKKILVTGGAGFVGSTICLNLKKKYPKTQIIALDNLIRKGSQLNVKRLKSKGVIFIKGDVRRKKDLAIKKIDLLIECSAEPSVMAGVNSSPEYLVETNLIGAYNCLELARKNHADVIFLSTSRVYPVKTINSLKYIKDKTRFTLSKKQKIQGASYKGISEDFPINGVRSLYGSTKLCAELLLQEYIENYKIKGVINRFGLISGEWQMGKIDQGVIVFWMSHHIFKKPLSYIGFKGSGKQVRDVINVKDVFDIINLQIKSMDKFNGKVYNIGGGLQRSISLLELTRLCQKITGNTVAISKDIKDRPGDIASYITDNTKIISQTKWQPKINVEQTLEEIYQWIMANKKSLEKILI